MAYEQLGFGPAGLEADADFSTKQFLAVKMSAANVRVSVCNVDGEILLGVLQNKPNTVGASVTVQSVGVTKIICGEALSAGDFWGTDSAGKAKKVEATITGADVGDYIAGQVLEGTTAANEVATVTIGFPTGIVEAQ